MLSKLIKLGIAASVLLLIPRRSSRQADTVAAKTCKTGIKKHTTVKHATKPVQDVD